MKKTHIPDESGGAWYTASCMENRASHVRAAVEQCRMAWEVMRKFDPDQPRDDAWMKEDVVKYGTSEGAILGHEHQGHKGGGTSEAAKKTLNEVESGALWNATKEEGFIIAQDGKIIEHSIGTEQSAMGRFLGPDDREKMRNAVFTHNHPSGDGLSAQDVVVAAWADMAEMRAFGTDSDGVRWTYSVQRPEKGWPKDRTKIKDIYKREYDRMMNKLVPLVSDGKLDLKDAMKQTKEHAWAKTGEKLKFVVKTERSRG